jgi:Zn-dependent peptidase ImmA (M78 family)/transcriptional regulator with XRE-family HTH domain
MPKIIKAPINHVILQWALKDLNLSVEEFAQRVKVKPEQVNRWLLGESKPTYKQLEKIAYKILKLPLASFFLAERPENLTIKRKFRTLPEYLLDLTSYKTRIAIKQADFYKSALYGLFGTNPIQNPIFRRIRFSAAQSPVEAAQQIRDDFIINIDVQKKFRNGYEAFNYYRNNLELKGIYLFQLQLSGDRGFCLLDNEFPIIVVNSSDSINSKIFTLFHELIHILLESDDIYKEVEPSPYFESNTEIFCNQTASEILVPSNELAERYSSNLRYWDEDLISKIANEHSVSKEVILLKIVSLRLASESDFKRLKEKWDKEYLDNRKKRGGGNYYVNKISALGRQYINTVIDSYKQGIINDVQVSNYLGMKFTNLPKIEAEVYA